MFERGWKYDKLRTLRVTYWRIVPDSGHFTVAGSILKE
jgi:hypothetical protein